eukprot:scaffold1530_cov98-Cylindrotheca_fusiformis.AAC.8
MTLPLMIYVAYRGVTLWFFTYAQEEYIPYSGEERMTEEYRGGVDLAQIVFGFMFYWDIPVTILTPAKRNLVDILHHLGMLFVAGVAMGPLCVYRHSRGSYYAPFFLGVMELSSIPLCYVDVFHPKHKPWFNYLNANADNNIGKVLSAINTVSRFSFAILFLIVRVAYFPYVALGFALPDTWIEARHEQDPALYTMCFLCVAFTGLQLYWGSLIVRQLGKALGALSSSSSKSKDHSN